MTPEELDEADSAEALQSTPTRAKADRLMPHSSEAEEHVIACCLLDGDQDGAPTLTRATGAGITSDSFYLPANRLLFQVSLDLRNSSLPVTLETVASELTTRRQLEAVGGYPYLLQITGKIPTTAHAGYFIEKVREKELLRRTIREATSIVEKAHAFTGGLDEFLQEAKSRIEWAAGVQKPKVVLSSRRVKHSAPPPEPETRLYLADKPIATPGNIQTLISRAKTGKTATLGAATAAVITASLGTSSINQDTLKFRASNPNGAAVIVIDTEQSPYDAYTCYKRTLDRAGTTEDPKWLYHYSLVGLMPEQIKTAIDEAIATATAECKSVFLLILDGVADCVNSVNDEAECNAFVNWLRERTVAHNCPALCVIHSNEGIKNGDDGRGHLGKQLTRKAESNLLLKKTGEVTTITSEKQRKAPITESDGVAFQWSDEAQRHVTCEPAEPKQSRAGRKKMYDIHMFMDCIPKKGESGLTAGQIHRFAVQIAEIKISTFKDLLAEAAKDGVLARTYDRTLGYSYTRAV